MRWLICVLSLFLALLQAQTRPDLTGYWVMQPGSSPSRPGPPINLRIEQEQTKLRRWIISPSPQGERVLETSYALDGSESINIIEGAMVSSRAKWEDQTLVIDSKLHAGTPNEILLLEKLTLSADGKTLTMEMRSAQAGGQAREMRGVFERRPMPAERPKPTPFKRDERPAEVAYKNIRLFKGIPAWRIIPTMMGFSNALGVPCAHCHVPNEFEKEDKPAKATARKMQEMVNRLQTELGDGSITCYTCHRGHLKTQTAPPS